MLQDKPDFQNLNFSTRRPLYRRYPGAGHWILLPHALEIARRPDGTPDFQVDMVRSSDPGLAAYGVVDFRVCPVFDWEGAATDMQGAPISPGYFCGGWLRLQVREPSKPDSATILLPQRIASTALGTTRLASRMTPEGVTLLKRSLLEGTLMLDAWAEMVIEGVAPRFPVSVTLEGADLDQLRGLGGNTNLTRRGEIVGALAKTGAIGKLPANINHAEVAEAVADRLFGLLGTLSPSPDKDFAECWRMAWDTGESRLLFDLSQPQLAARVMVLRFDPTTFLRKATGARGIERLIIQRELRDFRTGYIPVLVTATLPDARTPALSCGVDISAPAKTPNRLSAIRETVEFQPPRDRQEVILRFAANEEPQYDIQTFVYAHSVAGVQEWRSPRRAHCGSDLRLAPDDFPARFVSVEVSPQLAREGDVSLTGRWGDFTQTILLNERQRTDTLVCPASATGLDLVCRLGEPGLGLQTAIPDAEKLFLDLSIFREFGSHQVDIELDFEDGPEVVALQFKAEDDVDAAAATLAFTRTKPKREFLWFANSPRSPGYRFRCFQVDAPVPWSEAQSPFGPLRLKAADLVKSAETPGITP